ncbi:MAG: carbohydrate ABC transporter permease [Gammaproteobacteria bacterium]
MNAGRSGGLARQRAAAARVALLPVLIVLGAVALWPLLRTVWFAFTDANLADPAHWRFVGLENFLVRYDGRWYGLLVDPDWWRAVRNTLVFTTASVALETVLGLIVALCLHCEFRGRGLVRAAILIPWAIPAIVSAKMWGWMLNDQFGIVNGVLLRLGILSEPVAWTTDPALAMLTVVLVDAWKTTPFMALLILAALQSVPRELYEAARLDGVGPVQAFRSITLPLIRPAVIVAVTFRTLDALRVFDLIYVLTPGSPRTASMSVFARQQLVDFQQVGYGSAASTLLLLCAAAACALILGANRDRPGPRA